VVKYLA